MNADAFAYWLQGALELNPDMLEKGMTPEQVQTVQDHLNLVFTKVTPDRFKEKEEKAPELPNLPVFNFPPFDPNWNVPICSGGHDSSSQLFCSQVNSSMVFPKEEEFYAISGCTLYSVGDNDEPIEEKIRFRTGLLKIC